MRHIQQLWHVVGGELSLHNCMQCERMERFNPFARVAKVHDLLAPGLEGLQAYPI